MTQKDGTKKMLRAVVNGQSSMKSEILGEIKKNREEINKVNNKVDKVREDLVSLEKRLMKRMDKIGLQSARLEDDTPTIKEFDKLEKGVTKVEQKIASI